jgi:hypothetical protein
MYFSKIFKVKEGKLDTLKNWMNELSTARRNEAIATFNDEHITREVFALFNGNDGNNYVIALNEANQEPLPSDKTLPINQEHAAIRKECLESFSVQGEVLLDLSI